MPLLGDNRFARLGDNQFVLVGGQTGCLYWGTNILPLLGDNRGALIGGQMWDNQDDLIGEQNRTALMDGLIGVALLGDKHVPYASFQQHNKQVGPYWKC